MFRFALSSVLRKPSPTIQSVYDGNGKVGEKTEGGKALQQRYSLNASNYAWNTFKVGYRACFSPPLTRLRTTVLFNWSIFHDREDRIIETRSISNYLHLILNYAKLSNVMLEIFHLQNVYPRINEIRKKGQVERKNQNGVMPTVFLRGNRDRDATIEIGSRYFIYYYYNYYYLGAAR